MKKGYCSKCRPEKRQRCEQTAQVCPQVQAELNRVENGYKKKRIDLILESEMTGPQLTWWNHTIYGAGYTED